MALQHVDDGLAENWRSQSIQTISASKMFYVSEGRNAWGGLWVTWYLDNFHINWEDARHYAEKKRTQGSVLNIFEIPAILLTVSSGFVLITELDNKDPPLENYKPPETLDQVIERKRSSDLWWPSGFEPAHIAQQIIQNPKQLRPKLHTTLGGVVDSFREDSYFWQPIKRPRMVVRLFGVLADGTPEAIRPGSTMRFWRARSSGGNYTLEWERYKSRSRKVGSDSIFRLVEYAEERDDISGCR